MATRKDADNGAESSSDSSSGDGKKKPKSTAPQGKDAIQLLRADHRTVEKLFAEYESCDDNTKKAELAGKICKELIIHAELEEMLFYPACREAFGQDVEDDDLDEAQVEHDSAKFLIAELLAGEPDDDFYDAKVTVLREVIKHHVAEEEKAGSGIFARARKADIDLAQLGREISAQKAELEEDYDRAARRPELKSFKFASSEGLARRNREEKSMANRQDYYDERDEQGRFVSDDDRGGNRRSMRSDRYGDSGYQNRRDNYRDDDQQYRGRQDRYDDDRPSYRGRDSDDDYRRNDRSGRQNNGSGWYGDSERHSQAARQGWRDGHQSQRRDDSDYDRYGNDDDRRYGGYSRGRARDDEGRFRSRDDDDRRGTYRGRDDDNDDRYGSSRGGDSGQGWYGDSEGHSRAARKGWQNR